MDVFTKFFDATDAGFEAASNVTKAVIGFFGADGMPTQPKEIVQGAGPADNNRLTKFAADWADPDAGTVQARVEFE